MDLGGRSLAAEPRRHQGARRECSVCGVCARARARIILQRPPHPLTFPRTRPLLQKHAHLLLNLCEAQPQLWVPLDFNADGSIKPLRFLDNFTMDVVP